MSSQYSNFNQCSWYSQNCCQDCGLILGQLQIDAIKYVKQLIEGKT